MKLMETNTGADREACTPDKQQTLDFRTEHGFREKLSVKDVNKVIVDYIGEKMLSVSTFDSPIFRRIIEKTPTEGHTGLLQKYTSPADLQSEDALMDSVFRTDPPGNSASDSELDEDWDENVPFTVRKKGSSPNRHFCLANSVSPADSQRLVFVWGSE